MKKPSLFIIFLTVFIDLVGFGMVLPLLPLFAKNLDAGGWIIGSLMGVYSLMQFLFAPSWGRLSDRVGRRPVLLVSTAGAAISYAVFAVGSPMSGHVALVVLFASRIIAGICGANITVAQAYIADITTPEDRSKRMGLIGMAFGLGFIFGPAIGGLSLRWLGIQGPGWLAAGFCAANFVFAWFKLPESRQPSSEHVPTRPGFHLWMDTLAKPQIGLLVALFFLATFCFTCFETTLGLLVSKNFGLDLKREKDATTITYLFAFCGVIGAVVQGGAIGRVVRKLGEPGVIAMSLLLVAISIGPMPYAKSWTALLSLLALLSIGSSLARPPIFGLLSILTPPHQQGATIGVAQGAGSLARIMGPLFAATMFDWSLASPYVICGIISFITGVAAIRLLAKTPVPATELAQ